MLTARNYTPEPRLVWLIVAIVFVTDLFLPRQFDIAFAYLLPLFLAIFFRKKNHVLWLTVITTTLTIIAAAFKPHDFSLGETLLERLPAVLSCWAAAFFALRFIVLRETKQQQEGKFEALFRYASEGILLTDRRGIIIMANTAVETLFGYEEDEMLGQAVEILIPGRLKHPHENHREHYGQDPRPRHMGTGLDLQGLKKDGSEFPVEVSLSPFRTAEGEFVVAFIVDNTKRKNYEDSILAQKQELDILSEALRELNEGLENSVAGRTAELEQAKNELSAALDKERELGELKSRFVSMASHEFRTPLTAVLSSAGLVGQYAEREDFENVQKHASRIKTAVNGLNTILTEFLSLGRLEEGHLQPKRDVVDLPAFVEEVHQEMKNLFKTGQTLHYAHSGDNAIHLDGGLLKNILINLISNAVKYSGEGKKIYVTSVVGERTSRISVRDEGMGIPNPEQKHLFGRFFRASNAANSTQGTGLGLYIVQRYAEMMGGRVGFSSEVEKGSEFWVEFSH
ncbi:MAG: ATP-binding protein [Saprospiraceae bacterium]